MLQNDLGWNTHMACNIKLIFIIPIHTQELRPQNRRMVLSVLGCLQGLFRSRGRLWEMRQPRISPTRCLRGILWKTYDVYPLNCFGQMHSIVILKMWFPLLTWMKHQHQYPQSLVCQRSRQRLRLQSLCGAHHQQWQSHQPQGVQRAQGVRQPDVGSLRPTSSF